MTTQRSRISSHLAEPNTEQLALCVLVKTKEPKIEWHMTHRTGGQLIKYLAKVRYVVREISGQSVLYTVGPLVLVVRLSADLCRKLRESGRNAP